MPSSTKIKHPEVQTCHRVKDERIEDECLCVTCRFFYGDHSQECNKKRCIISTFANPRPKNCKRGNNTQCESYKRRKDEDTNPHIYSEWSHAHPKLSWHK